MKPSPLFPLSVILALALVLPAKAELGGNPTAAVAGQGPTRAVRKLAPSASYTVQEIQTEDGGTIREYILPSGEVFGVAWNGRRMPNLQSLFGIHFQTYRDELEARLPDRSPVRINRSDLVVQSGGHARAFRGRAYLPQRVPAGVSTDEIK